MRDFKTVRDEGDAHGNDNRDCAVIAVALLADVSYAEAHQALKKRGRRDSGRTHNELTRAALGDLGCELVAMKKHHLPATVGRCDDELSPGTLYLIRTSGHILAFTEGRVQDWTSGRRHRPTNIWKVTRRADRII